MTTIPRQKGLPRRPDPETSWMVLAPVRLGPMHADRWQFTNILVTSSCIALDRNKHQYRIAISEGRHSPSDAAVEHVLQSFGMIGAKEHKPALEMSVARHFVLTEEKESPQ